MDAAEIRRAVLARFERLARDPASETRFPTGAESALALGYDAADLAALPPECAARFAGVGNPLALAPLGEGERVLDVGCGSGVDALLAARRVGARGRVLGLDLAPSMVEAARAAARALGLRNARFEVGAVEAFELPAASFDVAISNGALNLCPDKPAALRAIRGALRAGGRLQLADVVLEEGVGPETVACVGEWSD